MNCRTARILRFSETLSAAERGAYAAHLASCAACRDDEADSFSTALVAATRDHPEPSADFTARLLAQLPATAPLELHQHALRQRLRAAFRPAFGVVAAVVVALVLGLATRSVWNGTTLGVAAAAIQRITVAAPWPLLVMIAGSGALLALLRTIWIEPRPRTVAFGSAAALALLAITIFSVNTSDARNLATIAQTGSGATIARPISETGDGSRGAGMLASMFGSIQLDRAYQGTVASITGQVVLAEQATIDGDVLVGAGLIAAAPAQVHGTIRPGLGQVALGRALVGSNSAAASPLLVRSLGMLLGALATLALAAIVVLLWPQRVLETSRRVARQLWLALGIGVAVTALIALLLLPTLAVLAATVLGLVAVPLILIAINLVYIQGLAAVGQALGQRLTGSVSLGSSLWGVGAQIVVVLLLALVAPPMGLAAFYVLGSIGLGAQLLTSRLAI